jgi:hypothetical protein
VSYGVSRSYVNCGSVVDDKCGNEAIQTDLNPLVTDSSGGFTPLLSYT